MCFYVIFFRSKSTNKYDLEIYTVSNIYYINGLTVTNEVNDDILIFKDMENLKEYISNVTSEIE